MAKAVAVFRNAAEAKLRLEREAEEERVRNEELRRQAEQDAITRERAAVEGSIGAGLAKLAAKDLTYRMTDDLPEAYRKLQSDFNEALEQLEQAVLGVRASVQVIDTGTAEIATRLRQPGAPHRATGREPGRNRGGARGDHRHGQQGGRGRGAGPAGGGDRARRRGCRRRCGAQGGGGGRRHREIGPADQPDHRRHRRDRLPDQPAGAQRRRRSGAGRRRWPRLRRGGRGSARAGQALGQRRQADQGRSSRPRPRRSTRA